MPTAYRIERGKNPTTALVTGMQASVTLFIGIEVKIVFSIGYGMTALRMCAIMPSFYLNQGDMNPSVFQLLDIVDTGYHSCNTSPQEVWICEPSVLTNWHKRPKNYNIPFRFSHLPAILWPCQRRNLQPCISRLFTITMLYHLRNRCRRHGAMENERRTKRLHAFTAYSSSQHQNQHNVALRGFLGHHRAIAPAQKK